MPPASAAATAAHPVEFEEVRPPVVQFLPKPFTVAALLASVRAAASAAGQDDPLILSRTWSRSEHLVG